jgi:hypothetical protein
VIIEFAASAPVVFASGLAVVSAAGYGAWRVLRRLRDPRERERRRRAYVHRSGRMDDAVITDVRDQVIYYSYELRGVAYATSQDVSALAALLPADPALLVGHVGLKYDPRNPANSIVVCEEWSGLRSPPFAPQTTKGDVTIC